MSEKKSDKKQNLSMRNSVISSASKTPNKKNHIFKSPINKFESNNVSSHRDKKQIPSYRMTNSPIPEKTTE